MKAKWLIIFFFKKKKATKSNNVKRKTKQLETYNKTNNY
jgi:hypothetical protein